MATVKLSAKHEIWARIEVAAGRAASIDDAVANAIGEMFEDDSFEDAEGNWHLGPRMQERLDEASQSIARGEGRVVRSADDLETVIRERGRQLGIEFPEQG